MGIGLEWGGIFNSVIEEIVIPLESNSLLTLYSDGVTELMNTDNKLFGETSLRVLLQNNLQNNCRDTMKTILDDLNFHKDIAPQNDDITMVLIKVDNI